MVISKISAVVDLVMPAATGGNRKCGLILLNSGDSNANCHINKDSRQ